MQRSDLWTNAGALVPGAPGAAGEPGPAPWPDSALGYCGICHDFYEYQVNEAGPARSRCPLCGYYAGDC
jgi:hypothetical protein